MLYTVRVSGQKCRFLFILSDTIDQVSRLGLLLKEATTVSVSAGKLLMRYTLRRPDSICSTTYKRSLTR